MDMYKNSTQYYMNMQCRHLLANVKTSDSMMFTFFLSVHTVKSRFSDGLQRVKELNANKVGVYYDKSAAFKTDHHFNHN